MTQYIIDLFHAVCCALEESGEMTRGELIRHFASHWDDYDIRRPPTSGEVVAALDHAVGLCIVEEEEHEDERAREGGCPPLYRCVA